MKPQATYWASLVLASAAAASIVHSLASLAPADPDAFVDLGDGLVLTPDKTVVEAWTLPGALSEEDAAFLSSSEAGPSWAALLAALSQGPLTRCAGRCPAPTKGGR